jgi:hypothetical protein
MIGTRFTRLTLIREAPRAGYLRRYVCLCDCGAETVAYLSNLQRGATKSCGCLKRERNGLLNRKHGMSTTVEYRAWAGIKKRCYSTSSRGYQLWGGRGIRMSRKWKSSFETFLRDMGPRPSPKHSVERRDNNGHYCKDNCYWALRFQQVRNRRCSHYVTYRGQRMHLKTFSETISASYFSVYDWIVRRGLSTTEAALRAANSQSKL